MVEPANGILLISDPFLKDPNFMRTVVLLCEHNEEGTFGLVLNRRLHQKLSELVTGLDGVDMPVFYGGPVQMDTLHFIHQMPEEIPGSKEISRGIYWGGDFDIVTSLLRKGILDDSNIRFYIGYSGWGSGQLDDELEEKSWLTVKSNRKLIFHDDVKSIWKDALKQMGGQYVQLIHYPTDPQLN